MRTPSVHPRKMGVAIASSDVITRIQSVGSNIDWSSPYVIAGVIVVAILLVVRKWSLFLVAVMVLAAAKALRYFLTGAQVEPGLLHGVITGVYVVGAVLFFFMAVAHFFTRE